MDEMDQILKDLKLISEQHQQIYDHAYKVYTDAVNSMVSVLLPDERQVEQLLDGLLDFCDDNRFLKLYKKLCRHVYALYPHLVTEYVQLYHSEYEEQKPKAKQTKKHQNNSNRAMVMFLETDLKKATSTSFEKMNELQRRLFDQMSAVEQQKILGGYATSVVDLDNGNVVCQFNMEHYFPPKHAIESFARQILPDIEEFYSHEENRREFEEWKKQQDKDKGVDK